MDFDPHRYDPAVAALLVPERLAELGPGRPNVEAREQLEAVASLDAACRAGLWLYHDFLDEAHEVSQSLDTPEGSYWHAIMHRREPDPENAKYWLRRVGRHPIHAELANEAGRLARAAGEAADLGDLAQCSTWDAARFVELCEEVRSREDEKNLLCRRIQLREWQLLFDYCYGRAGNDRTERRV